MALLTCSDVTFSYEGIPVLTDVNFALEAGSYLCIVGENGSGKKYSDQGTASLKKSVHRLDHNRRRASSKARSAICRSRPPHKRISRRASGEVVLSGRQNHPHFPPFYTKADKEDALAIWSFSTSFHKETMLP